MRKKHGFRIRVCLLLMLGASYSSLRVLAASVGVGAVAAAGVCRAWGRGILALRSCRRPMQHALAHRSGATRCGEDTDASNAGPLHKHVGWTHHRGKVTGLCRAVSWCWADCSRLVYTVVSPRA